MANEFKALNLPNAPYFNSGVVLIDSEKWNSGNWFKKISVLSKKYRNESFAHDQSLLNLAFINNWVELSPSWNWQYSAKIGFLTDYVSPRIVHFIGPEKHWHAPDGYIPLKYISAYRNFQKKYCRPEVDSAFKPFAPENIRKARRVFFKNVWYLGRHLKYLKRMETDVETIDHRQVPEA